MESYRTRSKKSLRRKRTTKQHLQRTKECEACSVSIMSQAIVTDTWTYRYEVEAIRSHRYLKTVSSPRAFMVFS
jgi:hypothetical protein